MAGGIDWFRWHHGTSGDRKFPLVAKRAGARVGDVIAMWAILLEQASASEDRGHPGHIDFEAIDLALDLTEGMAQTIHAAMITRGLVDGDTGRLVAWERRQPKRERPDDHSTERSRAHRAMQRHATPEDGNATPRNATASQETPREEKSREEKNSPSLRSGETRKRVACPDDVGQQTWEDWTQLRKQKKAPVTETVLSGARAEAIKAGLTLEQFLAVWCVRGSQGLQADWLKPHERGGQAPPNRQTAIEERNRAAGEEWLRQEGFVQ